MIHRRTHPETVEGCFACKLCSVSIAPSAMPSRSPRSHATGPQEHISRVLAREKRWDRDMPAYKRLVDDGVQPPQIDGSADLESRSTVRDQVETGHPEWSEKTLSAYAETFGHGVRETPHLVPDAAVA